MKGEIYTRLHSRGSWDLMKAMICTNLQVILCHRRSHLHSAGQQVDDQENPRWGAQIASHFCVSFFWRANKETAHKQESHTAVQFSNVTLHQAGSRYGPRLCLRGFSQGNPPSSHCPAWSRMLAKHESKSDGRYWHWSVLSTAYIEPAYLQIAQT